MTVLRLTAVLAAGISVSIALAACGGSESQSRTTPAPSDGDGAVTLTREPRAVTTDLQAPWSVVFRDGTALVSERDSGRILELADDRAARVVGTIDGVAATGEGGLLGLAVDDRGRLYVYSTGADGNRIERYELTGPSSGRTPGTS